LIEYLYIYIYNYRAANGPSARSGHRMINIKKQLFLFGGFHDNLRNDYTYFNDIYVFDLETYTWQKIEATGKEIKQKRNYLYRMNFLLENISLSLKLNEKFKEIILFFLKVFHLLLGLVVYYCQPQIVIKLSYMVAIARRK